VTWYNLSQRLATHAVLNDQCLAKLHRNLASTYLWLNDLSHARDNLERAEKLDRKSPHLFYLQFKLSLLQNDDNAGTNQQSFTQYADLYVMELHQIPIWYWVGIKGYSLYAKSTGVRHLNFNCQLALFSSNNLHAPSRVHLYGSDPSPRSCPRTRNVAVASGQSACHSWLLGPPHWSGLASAAARTERGD